MNTRHYTKEEWIERHASGTLRKNTKIGLLNQDQYLEERVAFTFGWHWEIIASTRITIGKAKTYSDCKALTEFGWHVDRFITHAELGDVFDVGYLTITREGNTKTGLGIVLTKTNLTWIPENKTVFALLCEEINGEYKSCLPL